MINPYSRKVYYYETDKMGIMHHSNHIRILEEARIDFLEQRGMPFAEIEARGVTMPVLSVECTYKHPLRFGDRFEVHLNFPKYNGVVLNVEYRIINADTGELCAVAKSSHCFTDMELKPLRLKHTHPEIYEVFLIESQS